MNFADAKTYAWLHKVSGTREYKLKLLWWLEQHNPHLYQLVLKEIGGDRDRSSDPQTLPSENSGG